MAHATLRLVLLRSRPDTVHGDALHKTLLSTFLAARGPSIKYVEKGVRLCIADFRCRVPLTPHLRAAFILYTIFHPIATVFLAFFSGIPNAKGRICHFIYLRAEIH